jgi:hypothetical protein
MKGLTSEQAKSFFTVVIHYSQIAKSLPIEHVILQKVHAAQRIDCFSINPLKAVCATRLLL